MGVNISARFNKVPLWVRPAGAFFILGLFLFIVTPCLFAEEVFSDNPKKLLELLLNKIDDPISRGFIQRNLTQNEDRRERQRLDRRIFTEVPFGSTEGEDAVILVKTTRKIDTENGEKDEIIHIRAGSASLIQIYRNIDDNFTSNFFVILGYNRNLSAEEDRLSIDGTPKAEWFKKKGDNVDSTWFEEGSPYKTAQCILLLDLTSAAFRMIYGNITYEDIIAFEREYAGAYGVNLTMFIKAADILLPGPKSAVRAAAIRSRSGNVEWFDSLCKIQAADPDNALYDETDIGEEFAAEIGRYYQKVDTAIYPAWVLSQQAHILSYYPNPNSRRGEVITTRGVALK